MALEGGAVHVWLADLDALGDRLDGLLDYRELQRAGRIVRVPARRRWTAARGALRALLGVYLDEDPTALRFARGSHGKPSLDPHTGLHFNLSHSGGVAIYALTKLCPIGVDVELVVSATGRPRSVDFLRAWVRAEADGKRTGAGVRSGLPPSEAAQTGSWISEISVGAGAVAAIALASAPVDFQVYAIDF
jgi:phosphopantetheinyl transferase